MIDSVASPTTTASATSAAMTGPGGAMGKDEFLKLLVAQLRHQDPLNPMDGQEFAAQLAQFTSVEQLIALNEGMAAQAASQDAMATALNDNLALGAIGKTVVAVGDGFAIPADGSPADASFIVDGVGGRGTLKVYNAAGHEVGSRDLGVVYGGRQSVAFGEAAAGLPPGSYTFAVEVVDSTGAKVATETLVRTRIDGIRYTPEGVVLTGGAMQIPFGSILEIVG